ncbi:MFS transporter [Bailinhaonella thermotolerans]|uniref:MFS transporter n=2 Tax=Bailinhaonella thermotolerans TaxID=1070861 RepID=A0A3A4BJA2_9ACTN|nr:MFS transporter [Bailinhaonella thermotolerans]
MAVTFAISPLVAARLSGSDIIGGLAGTATTLGAALLAIPTAWAASRGGRREGLAFAYGAGLVGGLISVGAVAIGSWPLLLAGLVLFGGGTAANLAGRYAATDLSAPGRGARDLSIVVWATTIGTVLGPNLAAPADSLGVSLGLPADGAPFAVSALSFVVAAVIVFAGLRPDPLRLARGRSAVPAGQRPKGSALAVLRTSRGARNALIAITVSHTAMVSVMSMTSVHLGHGGAHLSVIGLVLSLHIAGMYVLSPLVGWLADRIGRERVVMLGMLQLIAAAATAGTASQHDVAQVTIGLVLLGTGWSCGLVAGSALLTESTPLDRRPAVQGLSDMLMNGGGALGSAGAGTLVAAAGYGGLATAVGALVAVALAWTFLTRAR